MSQPHSQDCERLALGAAVVQSEQALGSGLFAAKPKRVSAVLADVRRLAEKLLDEGRVPCGCSVADQQARIRALSGDRRAARGLLAVVNGAQR